jgi:hypothetical protein
LKLIAAFKFVKAAALIAGGIAALRLLSPERARWAQDRLEGFAMGLDHRFAAELAGRALGLLDRGGSGRWGELAALAFLSAGVMVTQGVGLALGRLWAQYLTVVVTMSFLPIELVSFWRHSTLLGAGAIVVNTAVVAYLLLRLRAVRRTRTE